MRVCVCSKFVSLHLQFMSRHSTCAHFTGPWMCVLKTLTFWANMPLWRHGGILSLEIESKIKPFFAQQKEKSSTHSLTDIRACSFSHAGVINLGLSVLKNTLLTQKNRIKRVRNGNNWLVQWQSVLVQLRRLQDCWHCVLNGIIERQTLLQQPKHHICISHSLKVELKLEFSSLFV